MRPARPFSGAAVAAVLVAVGAAPAAEIDLAAWDYEALAAGWSAEQMLGSAEVYDQDGDLIGEVEDFIAGPDGRTRRIVVEAGGFFDIGDTHFAYPFAQAEIVGPERVRVALDEDAIESYGLFAAIEGEPAAGRNWRLTELLNDYAHLEDGVRFGWIDDAIIGAGGEIRALVVYPDFALYPKVGYRPPPRPVALPFDPERFEPGLEHYEFPYELEEVAGLGPFTYGGPR